MNFDVKNQDIVFYRHIKKNTVLLDKGHLLIKVQFMEVEYFIESTIPPGRYTHTITLVT